MQLRPVSQIGSRRLEALDGGIDLLRRAGRIGQQREGVEGLGLLPEDRQCRVAGLLALASEVVDSPRA